MMTTIRALSALCACTLLLAGCADRAAPPVADAVPTLVQASLAGSLASISRVAVTATKAGSSLSPQTLTKSGADYVGTLELSPGTWTLSVDAYTGSLPSFTLVGHGEAGVTVVSGLPSAVRILILDTTGPEPKPDHGPLIVQFTSPATTVGVQKAGNSITVKAQDYEDDLVTVSLSVSPAGCASLSVAGGPGQGTATFTTHNADAPVTVGFTALEPGTCSVMVRAAAKGLQDAWFADVLQEYFPEDVAVTGLFLPWPYVSTVSITGLGLLDRSLGGPAGFEADVVGSTTRTVEVTFDAAPWLIGHANEDVTFHDSCGTTFEIPVLDSLTGSASVQWHPAATAPISACYLTIQLTRGPFTDEYVVATTVTQVDDPLHP